MPDRERPEKRPPPGDPLAPQPRPDDVPVDIPPPGPGKLMARMKAEAREGIEEALRMEDPDEAFLQGMLLVFGAMRPAFGPANATRAAARR